MSATPKEQRRYDEAELRDLIETLPVPAILIRDDRMLAANTEWLQTHRVPRERVEGRPLADVIPREDRERLTQRWERGVEDGFKEGRRLRAYVITIADRPVIVSPSVKLLHASDGGLPFILVVSHVLEETQPGFDFSAVLAKVSAAFIGQRTEEGVFAALVTAFEDAEVEADLLIEHEGRFRSSEGRPIDEETIHACRAVLEQKQLKFAGSHSATPLAVLLPIEPGEGAILRLTASGLSLNAVPHLDIFIKLFHEALANARSLSESARQNEELRLLADLARMASEPQPQPIESFLAKIIAQLGASAAALHGPLAREHRVLAQVGVPQLEGLLWSEAVAVGLGDRATLPLSRGDVTLATLEVFHPKRFTDDARRLLETLGNLMVSVIEHRRLREASARQLTETRLLLDLARTTAGTLETASILDVACDFLVKLLDVSNSYIFLLEPNGSTLRGAAASANHREQVRSVHLPLDGRSVAGRTARERRTIAIEDTDLQKGTADENLVRAFGSKAVLGLPLISRDELIGVVTVDDCRSPRSFSPQLIELAQATIGQLALSIANARLYESLWRSYAELAATRAEMVKRERLAALGELSAVVAHEVRNPLGAIFNAVASLKRLLLTERDVSPAALEDAAMLLEVLAEESERLDGMVSDLLDFTRPRELMLLPEPVGALVVEALEAARHQPGISAGRVTFATDFDAALPPVPMDRKLIRQVLVNIMVNAIQAMPRGGRVRVRARSQTRDSGEVLQVDILDEGPGIASDLLPRVFEPFFTTKAKGTGLGLAVVKRIVEEHGGEVAVSSASGVGTTFTFFLPIAPYGAANALRRATGSKG